MSVTTAEATALTTEQVSTILTKPLEAASVFLSSGARVFDTTGPLRIPTAPASELGDVDFVGESEEIDEVDPDLTQEVTLLPSTMKSVKTLTRYSNELARQSVVSLDSVLRDRLVADVVARLDTRLLSDGGDGIEEPLGLFAYSGVGNVDVSGALTLDHILDAQAVALGNNVDLASLSLLIRPDDLSSLRKLVDGDNRYMLQPDAQRGGIPTILGLPVTVSSRIPSGNAAVLDWSAIAVARDLNPSVKILTERYAEYDEQAIRVVARYDAAPLNPEAIVTLTGIA